MELLRWTCSHIRKDQIRNGVICNKVGVAPIEDGLARKRSIEGPVRSVDGIKQVVSKRDRGRLKKYFIGDTSV